MIKNIIFDIGDVLTRFNFDGYLESIFDAKTVQVVSDVMWNNPDWSEFDKGYLSDEEVLKLFIAKEPDYEKEIRLTFSKLGLIPHKKDETIPLIEKLKGEGYKVYFLSNYFEYLMHVAPEALDFLPYMDGGIFSCDVHEIKPNRAIYEIICKKYSLNPAECLFIDDSERNIIGASEYGMNTIWYKGQDFDELYEMIKEKI